MGGGVSEIVIDEIPPYCERCKQEKVGKSRIHSHHIVPRKWGGDDSAINLIDLCPRCHVRLHRFYEDEAVRMAYASDPEFFLNRFSEFVFGKKGGGQ